MSWVVLVKGKGKKTEPWRFRAPINRHISILSEDLGLVWIDTYLCQVKLSTCICASPCLRGRSPRPHRSVQFSAFFIWLLTETHNECFISSSLTLCSLVFCIPVGCILNNDVKCLRRQLQSWYFLPNVQFFCSL